MEAIVEKCCGLDVHQATVVACLLVGTANRKPKKEVRTFRTVTRELLAMRSWLEEHGCTHVAMESTGVYWKPVYAVLEGAFELVVGNAHHIKNVPGRKTDVKDSEWIADLLRHGVIAKSFVPPPPLRELRDLLRYRRKLVESGTSERSRLLSALETANIKLASVASDVFGVSGMLILAALIEGKSTPEQMARLAKGKLRDKLVDLQLALEGSVGEHHRFLLSMQLRRLKAADEELKMLDNRIDEKLEPYRAQHNLLMTIPGVEWFVAAVLIAEIGIDMKVFVSARQLAAWAGVSPGTMRARERRRAARRAGECPPQDSPRHRSDWGVPLEGHLSEGQIPPAHAPRRHSRSGGNRPQDPRRSAPDALEERSVPGARRLVPRQDRRDPHCEESRATPRATGLHRPTRTQTRGVRSERGGIFVAGSRRCATGGAGSVGN